MVGFGESWDEALFGGLESAQPAKEAVPAAKKIMPEEAVKEFLPEGSGGRALEENKKAQSRIEQEIADMTKNLAAGTGINWGEVKRKRELLDKFKEDEGRIRAGGI